MEDQIYANGIKTTLHENSGFFSLKPHPALFSARAIHVQKKTILALGFILVDKEKKPSLCIHFYNKMTLQVTALIL